MMGTARLTHRTLRIPTKVNKHHQNWESVVRLGCASGLRPCAFFDESGGGWVKSVLRNIKSRPSNN
jgi:hypothetical protein